LPLHPLQHLPRWLTRADACLLHRLWELLFMVVRTCVVGGMPMGMPPGVCNMMRSGGDIPVMMVLAWLEPVGARVLWVGAAVTLLLDVPTHMLMQCACAGAPVQHGTEALCTRASWGALASEVHLVAFLAARVAMPLATNVVLCWLSARARNREREKRDSSAWEKQA
jgi:hypothetical protein